MTSSDGSSRRRTGSLQKKGGYGSSTQDLYLATAIQVDEATGDFVVDKDGSPIPLAGGLLVRWEEVEYLEFIDA